MILYILWHDTWKLELCSQRRHKMCSISGKWACHWASPSEVKYLYFHHLFTYLVGLAKASSNLPANMSCEAEKYNHCSPHQEWLCWQRPAANYQTKPKTWKRVTWPSQSHETEKYSHRSHRAQNQMTILAKASSNLHNQPTGSTPPLIKEELPFQKTQMS